MNINGCSVFNGGNTSSSSAGGGGGRYLGVWDASTNTPTLSNPPTSPTYQEGDYYQVSVAGTQFGIDYTVGDDAIVVPDGADLAWGKREGGLGTVTTVSVASANGLAGSVANPTTTPAITLSTTVTGMLKGNGTAISAAVAGTDYVSPSELESYVPYTGAAEDLDLGIHSLLTSGVESNLNDLPIDLPATINSGSLTLSTGANKLLKSSFEYDSGTSGLCSSSLDVHVPSSDDGSGVNIRAKSSENIMGGFGFTNNSDLSGRVVFNLRRPDSLVVNYFEASLLNNNLDMSFGRGSSQDSLILSANTYVANGFNLSCGISEGDSFSIGAFNDSAAFKPFIALTSNATPSLAISAPSGTTGNIDNIVIGATTPANGNFDTITALNALAVEYGGTGQDSYTNGQILIGNASGGLTKTTLTAGENISITNGDGSIEISCTTPAVLPFTTVTTTSQNIAVNNGYIARSASSVDFTLPTTAAIGDIFEILYRSPSAGQLLQNADQTIIAGNQQTTVGSGGRIDGINNGEVLVIRCIDTNTEFMVISPVGNFNVV